MERYNKRVLEVKTLDVNWSSKLKLFPAELSEDLDVEDCDWDRSVSHGLT